MKNNKDKKNNRVFHNLNTQFLEYIKILLSLHIAITNVNELKQLG